jgi:hypothetical protein
LSSIRSPGKFTLIARRRLEPQVLEATYFTLPQSLVNVARAATNKLLHAVERFEVFAMRLHALATILLLSAPPAIAEPASKAERILFCKTIVSNLEKEAADMALDYKACLANGSIASNPAGDNKRKIGGAVKFNSPARLGFDMTCTATYAAPLRKKSVAELGVCG